MTRPAASRRAPPALNAVPPKAVTPARRPAKPPPRAAQWPTPCAGPASAGAMSQIDLQQTNKLERDDYSKNRPSRSQALGTRRGDALLGRAHLCSGAGTIQRNTPLISRSTNVTRTRLSLGNHHERRQLGFAR